LGIVDGFEIGEVGEKKLNEQIEGPSEKFRCAWEEGLR
jgi:hypothetical protein